MISALRIRTVYIVDLPVFQTFGVNSASLGFGCLSQGRPHLESAWAYKTVQETFNLSIPRNPQLTNDWPESTVIMRSLPT